MDIQQTDIIFFHLTNKDKDIVVNVGQVPVNQILIRWVQTSSMDVCN